MALSGSAKAIAGYAAQAAALAPRYDALPVEVCYAPVLHLMPILPTQVIDIGAGTGRDAVWFADRGHRVTAVEPVSGFRGAASRRDDRVNWLTDALPALTSVVRSGACFGYINIAGVWQHLDPGERDAAAPVLAQIAAPGALLMLSLRHGPSPADRPAHPISDDRTARLFASVGFDTEFRRETESIQPGNRAAGVRWTWFALRFKGDVTHVK